MQNIIKQLFPHLGLPKSQSENEIYPDFRVFCSVIKYRSPRHPYFEMFIEMGRGNIDKVFSKESFRMNELIFIFPERWMSVHEQHVFMSKMKEHPDAVEKKINNILLLTSSPLIVGSFTRESVRIITFEDDKPIS